jgi:hypothetical protein
VLTSNGCHGEILGRGHVQLMSANSKLSKVTAFALLVIFWFYFVLLLLPNSCLASLTVPRSFAIPSSDNQFLLVMRSSVEKARDDGCNFKLPSGQTIDLREKFQTNGIFHLDTFECVQPLDWFADKDQLFASGDLKVLVRLNQFAVETQNKNGWRWCLKFYANGKEVKQYQLRELVDLPNGNFLPFTTVDWHSVWYATGMFTNSNALTHVQSPYSNYSQFRLVTAPQSFGPIRLSEGNIFLFNSQTGEIQQEWRHNPWKKSIIFIIGVLCILSLLLVLLFRFTRKLHR